jgi:hypothetical protein
MGAAKEEGANVETPAHSRGRRWPDDEKDENKCAPPRAGSAAASTNEHSAAGASIRRPIRRTHGVRRSAEEVKKHFFLSKF